MPQVVSATLGLIVVCEIIVNMMFTIVKNKNKQMFNILFTCRQTDTKKTALGQSNFHRMFTTD